jgi:hypothetical protein
VAKNDFLIDLLILSRNLSLAEVKTTTTWDECHVLS